MARDSGSKLLLAFFDAAWLVPEDAVVEYLGWDEVVQVFFDAAPMIQTVAEKSGTRWQAASVAALDAFLEQNARSGRADGRLTVPDLAAPELWRRWKYAITAAQLEADHGAPLDLPMPRDAPGHIKAWAIVLYVLAGPARSYPRQMFPD